MNTNSSHQSGVALDALNFFLADVRDGLGPYLAIYLLAEHHWTAAQIGTVMTLAGLAALVAQTPAGALIDGTHAKRATVIIAALLVTASCLVLPWTASFTWVAITQSLSAVAASVFAPAIAALSLGLVGPQAFTRRTGRNEGFNHAGNAVAALLAGALALWLGPTAVFYLMAFMALASVFATWRIDASAIDHEQARGLAHTAQAATTPALDVLLGNRPLRTLALCCALFHLANAAMLPLVSQKLALHDLALATPLTSACIIAAQLVMVPMAWLVGARADQWGRKPLLLAGFLILPVRGVLYTLSDDAVWLVAIQTLDGIGAGLFGALLPLMVKDLTRGTGHFNVALGAVTTAFGLGAALSAGLAGLMVQWGGYGAGFLTLATVACVALLLLWWRMPETLPSAPASPSLARAL